MSRRYRCGLAGLAVLLLAGAPCLQAAVPSFAEVRAAHAPSDWVVTDRHGEPLQRMRRNPKERRLGWLPLAEMSPALQAALITAEDKRFWSHGGVDWAAFAQAAWDNLHSRRGKEDAGEGRKTLRGASTLTMQLAGLLDPALRPLPGSRRSWGQKWDQAKAARELEQSWSKTEILEAYLNLVPWRGEAVGLPAASQLWFGKSPHGLDLGEGALLAALIRQPQATANRVGERACAIVAALDPAQLPAAVRPDCSALKGMAVLGFSGGAAYAQLHDLELAPHAARRALAAWDAGAPASPPPARLPGGEPQLRTTLDARIQRLAVDSLRNHLRELLGQNVEDGAVVVLDNASGEILAYVGSSGSLSDAADVDGVTAPRQAGSTLKPFLYGLAIEQRRLTAASLLHDSPLALTAENGAYIPQNYDRRFKGYVSARLALASSLNIPAVRTVLLTGIEPFYDRLKALGLDTLTASADHYGLALALGGADVRLLDLANAYRALANAGRWQPVAPLQAAAGTARPARLVYPPAVAFIVGDILADRAARAPTFGLENALATRIWSAVKTGTSKDMRDNWCIGFTRRYTVGVWVGNFSGAPMWDVSGVHGAAPVWRELVHALHDGEPSLPPAPPAGVKPLDVQFDGLSEARRREWFLPGTETPRITRADLATPTDHSTPKILYPADGLIVAIDPDLPAAAERIVFQMEPLRDDLRWQLARSSPPCRIQLGGDAAWPPQPGNWTLQLVGPDQRPLAAVQFQVRGSARHPDHCNDPATGP